MSTYHESMRLSFTRPRLLRHLKTKISHIPKSSIKLSYQLTFETMASTQKLLSQQQPSKKQTFTESSSSTLSSSMAFTFKSISFQLIAILLILCSSQCDCNAIPTSMVLPPSPSSSAYLLSAASSDNAAMAERVSLERVAAAVQTNRAVNLTRQYAGDVFSAFGKIHVFSLIFFLFRFSICFHVSIAKGIDLVN